MAYARQLGLCQLDQHGKRLKKSDENMTHTKHTPELAASTDRTRGIALTQNVTHTKD